MPRVASPFKGHPLDSPYAERRAPRVGVGAVGGPETDPAWQAPSDPLEGGHGRIGVIRREVPISTTSTSWTVADVRSANQDLVLGLFDRPAQLVDSLMGASRVQAAMNSRTGGLLGREVEFPVRKELRDSALAKECAEAFTARWPEMGGEEVLAEIDSWGIMIGFGPAQLLWDLGGEYGTPHLNLWHPRYSYWHPTDRCLVAIGLDMQERITPGDGHWFVHAPRGLVRGWMRGAMRAVAEPWLARCYARRDWSRYSERHGYPILKARTPSDANGPDVDRFRVSLQNLGQESVIELPHGVDATQSYDLDYLEAKDQAHEAFQSLIASCDAEITLAIMSQNLTTEVTEGSYAAARVHADVRQSLLEADARTLARAVYTQIARPFAALNFGNPDLAPLVRWDVKPYEDDLTAAQTFAAFATALRSLRQAGLALDRPGLAAKRFSIDIGAARFEQVEMSDTGGGDDGEAEAEAEREAALYEQQRRARRARRRDYR